MANGYLLCYSQISMVPISKAPGWKQIKESGTMSKEPGEAAANEIIDVKGKSYYF